jgi:hypothetical protein
MPPVTSTLINTANIEIAWSVTSTGGSNITDYNVLIYNPTTATY